MARPSVSSAMTRLIEEVRYPSAVDIRTEFTRLLTDIRSDVETGTSLSRAFRKYPLYFDSLYCNLVGAGEQAGILEDLLTRLAIYKEKTLALKGDEVVSISASTGLKPASAAPVASTVAGTARSPDPTTRCRHSRRERSRRHSLSRASRRPTSTR